MGSQLERSTRWRRIGVIVTLACTASACPDDEPSEPSTCDDAPAFADQIVDAPGHVTTPSAIDEPGNAIDGVVQGDPTSGGLDVYSRGLSVDPPNNYIVLRWSGRRVVDVDGPDFVVFENAFETAGGVFMDPIVVEVSADGESWVPFPHDFLADDETKYSLDPADWTGFAGVTPVRWRSADCTSPFSDDAGGDVFDLADLDDPAVRDGFSFLRLTTAATVVNPDTGEPYPRYFLSDGFDLDGVVARETVPDP